MSRIKECFGSRFLHGCIIEADYSQLEIIALAYLSNDKQLQEDILSGKDLHVVRAAELFKVPEYAVTKEQRQLAKAFSFQLQYGAGAVTMASENDVSRELALTFINNYYARYRGVQRWQKETHDAVLKNRAPSTRTTKSGKTSGRGWCVSPTGRRYAFYEEDSKYTKTPRFSPTKIKNYPVQGFATGDIVPMMLGELFEEIKKHPQYNTELLMINTVHDSVIFDFLHNDKEEVMKAGKFIKEVMELAPTRLLDYFGIDFNLPLTVEVEAGVTWADKEKLDI